MFEKFTVEFHEMMKDFRVTISSLIRFFGSVENTVCRPICLHTTNEISLYFTINKFLPVFTASSHPHETLLLYPGSAQSLLSHAYPSELKSIAPSLYTH